MYEEREAKKNFYKKYREKEGESGASLVFCCAIMLQRVARGVMAAV
jgi:hypothetical protein